MMKPSQREYREPSATLMIWRLLALGAIPVLTTSVHILGSLWLPAAWTLWLNSVLWLGAMACVVLAWHLWSTWPAPPEQGIVPPAEEREVTLDPALALAAGLAHEMGQPLSVARVSIEGLHLLRQMGREPEAQHLDRALRDTGRSLLAMSSLVEHLQGLALQRRPTQLQRLDLAEILDRLLAERTWWLRIPGVRFVWLGGRPSAMPVLAEEQGLRLILVNLCKNAAEAVASLPEPQREVLLVDEGRAVLAMRNGGEPLSEHMQQRIFMPFVSGRDGHERVRGVGLYLARLAADRMGAQLRLSNEGDATVARLVCQESLR